MGKEGNMMQWIAENTVPLAALIVAIIALVTSGLAARYARREALASQEMVALEKAREQERKRPEIKVRFTAWHASQRGLAWFEIENKGTHSIESVKLELLTPNTMGFYREEGRVFHDLNLGPLEPGGVRSEIFWAWFESTNKSENIKFLATCRMSSDEWKELLNADLPPADGVKTEQAN
jgi:hypothetical protein